MKKNPKFQEISNLKKNYRFESGQFFKNWISATPGKIYLPSALAKTHNLDQAYIWIQNQEIYILQYQKKEVTVLDLHTGEFNKSIELSGLPWQLSRSIKYSFSGGNKPYLLSVAQDQCTLYTLIPGLQTIGEVPVSLEAFEISLPQMGFDVTDKHICIRDLTKLIFFNRTNWKLDQIINNQDIGPARELCIEGVAQLKSDNFLIFNDHNSYSSFIACIPWINANSRSFRFDYFITNKWVITENNDCFIIALEKNHPLLIKTSENLDRIYQKKLDQIFSDLFGSGKMVRISNLTYENGSLYLICYDNISKEYLGIVELKV